MMRKALFQNGLSIFKRKTLKHFTDCHRFPETPSALHSYTTCRRHFYISSHTPTYLEFNRYTHLSNGCGLRHLSKNKHLHSWFHPAVFTPCVQTYSTSPGDQSKDGTSDKDVPEDGNTEKHLSIFKRFKEAYKQHGKVLVGVHIVTSTFWAGGCYYLVTSGVDVIGILEWIGLSESIVNKFKSSHLGDIAAAYLFYKLFTPARYFVTLTGTNFTIKYLQKQGKMPKASERERFKDIVKDGQTKLKKKGQEIKEERLERKSKGTKK